MCTPAVPRILSDFHTDNSSYSTLLVSIWELGEGIGPLFIAPLSEYFGRLPVWHTCIILFAICSVAAALSVNASMLIVFRFLNGLVLASLTLSPTLISDIFGPEQRATAMAVAAMAPLVGPTFGPTLGGLIATKLGWRWIFWTVAIAAGAFAIPSLLVMRETYRVKLLQRKAARRDHSTGNSDRSGPQTTPQTLFSARLSPAIFLRAFKIWVTSPAVFVLALFLAMVYGYQYLVFTTFTEVLMDQYAFTTVQCGLAYFGTGIGSIIGILTAGITSDRYVRKKRVQSGGAHRPEDRLLLAGFGTVTMASGLFLYGWTAEKRVRWIAPICGTALQGFGLSVVFISAQAFLVEVFPVYAASTTAAGTIIRSIAGAVLPLAGPPLYRALGLGWGNSLLGFTALGILPVPLLLTRFGKLSSGEIYGSSFA
jgi:MFS family permease